MSANPIAIAGPKLGKGETGVLRCAFLGGSNGNQRFRVQGRKALEQIKITGIYAGFE